MVDGLHFTRCATDSDVLERILNVFEKLYGSISRAEVVTSGGHHIHGRLRPRVPHQTDKRFQEEIWRAGVSRAGEASVLTRGTGLVCAGYRQQREGYRDTGCVCGTHMPDVLLMPYRPHILPQAAERKEI